MKIPFFNKEKTIEGKKFFTKKKKIAAVVIVGVLAVSYMAFGGKSDEKHFSKDDFTILEPSAFASTISSTGKIITERDAGVYTTQVYPIKKVLVKEGDKVEEGQVLAYLDNKTLKKQIAIKEAAVGTTAATAAAQVKTARDHYDASVRALQNGTNNAIISAQAAADSAKSGWEAAEKTYQDYKKSLNDHYNPDANAQDSARDSADQAVESAKLAYDQALARWKDEKEHGTNATNDKHNYDDERTSLRKDRNNIQEDINYKQELLNSFTGDLAVKEKLLAEETNPANQAQLQADVNQLRSKIQDFQIDIQSLNQQLADVQSRLGDAESDYNKAQSEADSYDRIKLSKEQEVKNAKLAWEHAKANRDRVYRQSNGSEKSRQDMLATYLESAKTAKQSYLNAQKSLKAAKAAAQDELTSSADALLSSEVNAKDRTGKVELANLYDDLQETIIRAPMSGTVTQVIAKEGNTPAGLLFKIESADDLMIETNLKEFDVKKVKPGMKVEVKTDATGKKVFQGKVVSVASAATLADAENPTAAKETVFKCRISLHNPPGTLLAGMKARLNIVLAEDQGVYSVPYGAVKEENGQKFVYVFDGNDESGTVRKIPVETQLENDIAVVIEGKGLKDKMRVFTDPENITEGEKVLIDLQAAPGGEDEENSDE